MPSAPQFSPELVERLSNASRITAFTGAGISAESGIPTFRDPDGLWQKFKPEELANMQAFLNNPSLVQEWYAQRHRVTHECSPNAGHMALAHMEDQVPKFTLVTQNVDDLHNRAGSKKVIELHGNLSRSYCIDCERPAEAATNGVPGNEVSDNSASGNGESGSGASGNGVKKCPECGGLIRPDVVWFGEMLPEGAMEAAYVAARSADVFLSIGTSAIVYPAADLPIAAVEAGVYTVEVNIERSAVAPYVDEVILGKAGDVLPALAEAAF